MRIPPVLLVLLAGASARADAPPPVVTLSVESEAALAASLARRVLLLTVKATPGALEDPAFPRERFGQAVRTTRDGRTAVLTSARLVEDAARVEAATPDGRIAAATVRARDAEGGLADLETAAPSDVTPRAPAEACAPGTPLFLLAPGAGALHLTRAVMGPDAGPPIERLSVVGGVLPEGAPLFDAEARLAAVALWTPPGTKKTLVAPACAPKPEEPSPGAPGKAAAGNAATVKEAPGGEAAGREAPR
ncbi:MAG: hypothetical protein FJ087_04710 [Deltaproteobacteria bacterium]|nr:hypothetical protein [Deltaproteobacteria bacterium]